MNSTEMENAIIEISLDKTEGSKLRKKFPDQYKRLIVQIKEIKDDGDIVEIPPEIP